MFLDILEQALFESSKDEERVTRVYAFEARPSELDKLEQIFAWINGTSGGHSGSVKLSIDGDGRPRFKVKRMECDLSIKDGEAIKPKGEPMKGDSYEFDLDVGIE